MVSPLSKPPVRKDKGIYTFRTLPSSLLTLRQLFGDAALRS